MSISKPGLYKPQPNPRNISLKSQTQSGIKVGSNKPHAVIRVRYPRRKTSSFRMMQQPSGGVVPADQQPQQYQQPPQQWMMMSQQQQQAAQAAQAGWAQQQAAMQQQQQQPQQYTAAAPNQGSDEIRSLWIGDLLQWMDESYILSCFGPTGEVVTHTHMKLQFLNLGFTFMILKE